ncbi:MAG: hypothetical protein V1844_16005 [Pseudomonadota bacterium]
MAAMIGKKTACHGIAISEESRRLADIQGQRLLIMGKINEEPDRSRKSS